MVKAQGEYPHRVLFKQKCYNILNFITYRHIPHIAINNRCVQATFSKKNCLSNVMVEKLAVNHCSVHDWMIYR